MDGGFKLGIRNWDLGIGGWELGLDGYKVRALYERRLSITNPNS